MAPALPLRVTAAVLPLAARAHGASGDIDRAAFLISTLDRHWRDATPLRLIVVAQSSEMGAISGALQPTSRIRLDFRTEEAFFGPRDRFHALPGWWKQQVIKLIVPAALKTGPYLTFDADVACVRDIDGGTFTRDGKLVSQWYRQHRNGWWAASTGLLGRPYDPSALGLDVTPNVLHSDLSAYVLWQLAWIRLGIRGPKWRTVPLPVRRLATHQLHQWYEESQARARAGNVIPEDTWTEYALYTLLTGEALGAMHVAPSDDMPLLAHTHSIWFPAEREHLNLYTPATRPDAPFVVFQSTSGTSLAEVKAAVDRLH